MQVMYAFKRKIQAFIRLDLPNGNPPSPSLFRLIVHNGRPAFTAIRITMLSLVLLLCPACGSHKSTPAPVSPSVEKQETANIGLPVRLKIPKINVDAAIDPVGLTAAGAMDTPCTLDKIAWYQLGPRPGQPGSAVLAGHHSNKTSVPAVFDHLRDLQVGDYIFVEDDSGKVISFVVREIRIYDQGIGSDEVFNGEGGSLLNLVTCEGVWDEKHKTFSQRRVVFTRAAFN